MAKDENKKQEIIRERLRDLPDLSDERSYSNRIEVPVTGRIEKAENNGNSVRREVPDTTSDTQANKRFGDSASDE